jgi:two-component system response regulator (stage 0 sporulation protein F)
MGSRILIVDDEIPILFAMREYFTPLGYEVDCAREREEAEAMLANDEFSVVIADLRLTGINGNEGLEIVGFIRERSPDTRIVVLTAYGSPEIEMEARKRGADAFLHKPKPLSEVAQIVAGLLEDAS